MVIRKFFGRLDRFQRSLVNGRKHLDLYTGSMKVNNRSTDRQFMQVSFGLVLGTQPVYVVSDPAFIQEVFVTQFSKFHTKRGGLPFLTTVLGNNRHSVATSNGSKKNCKEFFFNIIAILYPFGLNYSPLETTTTSAQSSLYIGQTTKSRAYYGRMHSSFYEKFRRKAKK